MSAYLIWSIEHTAWWRPARCGYTLALAEAGRYSSSEAAAIVARANIAAFHECMIPIEAFTVSGHDPEAPALYDVAREVCHHFGYPWTDPRTGITYPPPATPPATPPASITCPRCGRTSYNPNDIEQRYCGMCHVFFADVSDCECRNPACGHRASEHTGEAGACVAPGCTCGPGGWR